MTWSFRIATVAGIGIFVHWTFLLLIGWIVFEHVAAGKSTAVVIEGVTFVLSLFGCVVLHELGHALTAKRYGVRTRDITLLPIGGVARLERIPEAPMQEFWVAVAGPAVNVAIAGVLYVAISLLGRAHLVTQVEVAGGQFFAKLMWVNVMLVVFNMLPAFPMDGGRVLRALLAVRMSRVRATHIAAGVGQFMAILFAVIAFTTHQWLLLFIALFVYLGAQGEAHAVEMRAIFKGARVRDAMISRFVTLSENDPLERAAREAMSGHQKDFPVTDGRQITGLLLNREVVKALSAGDVHQRVGEMACQRCPTVQENEPLDRAVDKMQSADCPALLVVRDGELVGLLTSEHLGDWILLHSAVQKRQAGN